jgi:hypothetical protein
MRTIDNEEVTFESIDDHFYKFDSPEVVEPDLEPVNRHEHLATAFTLARPILVAMIATPLIPERWQEAVDTLVSALDGVAADAKDSAGESEGELPVC